MRVLTVLGGVSLVAAGLIAFYGAELKMVAPLVVVAEGLVIILAARRKSTIAPSDVAVFVVCLLVLASVGAGFAYAPAEPVTYSAASSQVSATGVDLRVETNMGSVHVSFSSDPAVAYRVVFFHPSAFSGFPFSSTQHSFREETVGSVLRLDANAQDYSVNITLGMRYLANVNASSSLGSVSFEAIDNHNLGRVQLHASLGSIDASIRNSTTGGIDVSTSTGSVNLEIAEPRPAPQLSAPVSLAVSTGTGSVRFLGGFAPDWAVSLSASAGLGSVSQNLQGFTIDQKSSNTLEATAGNPGTSQSFDVRVNVGSGSVDLTATWG